MTQKTLTGKQHAVKQAAATQDIGKTAELKLPAVLAHIAPTRMQDTCLPTCIYAEPGLDNGGLLLLGICIKHGGLTKVSAKMWDITNMSAKVLVEFVV
jgi:hypothetical protein